MEALRLNEYITEKGLFIDNKKLNKFKNMRVEVIILPIEEKKEKSFMKFAGMINNEDGEKMIKSIEDCRNIEEENW